MTSVMDRRAFITIVGGSILAAPLVTEAQPTGKVYRIGFLAGGSPGPTAPNVDQFRQGLRELGYVEGQNIVIEYRWAEGKLDRLPELATDLVRLKVDLIVAPVSTSAQAAHHATRTIPIVMIGVGDPIALGLVGSPPHPGGNVTGNTSYGPELVGKNLEFLKEIVRRQGVRGRRRARILRAQPPRHVSAGGDPGEPNPQRRQAGRPPSRAADQVRVGDQPQDRQGARSDGPSVDPPEPTRSSSSRARPTPPALASCSRLRRVLHVLVRPRAPRTPQQHVCACARARDGSPWALPSPPRAMRADSPVPAQPSVPLGRRSAQ